MTPRLTQRQYDLLLTRTQKFAVAVPFFAFVLMALVFIFVFTIPAASDVARAEPPFFPLVPLVFVFAFAVFYAWSVATLPYRITVVPGQSLEFKSLIKVRTVRVAELVSIEPRSLQVQIGISGYALNFRDGRILFPGQFTGLHVLLTELEAANPALEIRGC